MLFRRNPAMALAARACCTSSGWRALCRVYAWLRWADDVVDAPGRERRATLAFVAHQAALHEGRRPAEHPWEDALLAALGDPVHGTALRVAAGEMLEAFAFDATRDARPIRQADLDAQVARVGHASARILWSCAGGPEEPPPPVLLLARAATAAHLLRDHALDHDLGFCNVPIEEMERLGLDPAALPGSALPWLPVRARVVEAWFREGLDGLRGVHPVRARILVTLLGVRYRRVLAAFLAPVDGDASAG